MTQAWCVVAAVLFVGACGSKPSGDTLGSPDPVAAQSGTPESVMPDNAAAGAADSGTAFVQATFDAHAASLVHATCAPNKLRLTLDGVLFDFDHDNLQPGGDDVLAQVKKVAVDAYPSAHIIVEGHTDNVGSDAHNDDLSARRAKTVVSWMEAHGVATTRLEAKGYGKRWPRVPNTTDANRAMNRRVEFIVLDQGAASACTKQPATGTGGGNLAGGPPGTTPGAGGPGDSAGPYVPTAPQAGGPTSAPGFSFHYNDKADARDHICFTYDPAWVPAGAPPMGYVKKDFSTHDGDFVDHCPTENVVATCDQRRRIPKMEWYYQGMTEAMLALRKQQCLGTFVRVAPAGAPPTALQLDTTHKYLGACDLRNAPEGNGRGTCVEYRDDANPAIFNVVKKTCPFPIIPRCPIEGATGRCDIKGAITLYYVAQNNAAARVGCEAQTGTWSQP